MTSDLKPKRYLRYMPVVYYQTPIGIAKITEENSYITSIIVIDQIEEGIAETPETDLLRLAIQQLNEYFKGDRRDFNLPLNQSGSAFQKQVWQQLQQIGYGKTLSYLQLSNQMNNLLAIRAIAAANGKNNLWIVVPCHRVIGSDGSLTGYAGGLWRKQWLLEHEAKVCGVGQTKLFL